MKIKSIEFYEEDNEIIVETKKYGYRFVDDMLVQQIWSKTIIKFPHEDLYWAGDEFTEQYISKDFTKEVHAETGHEINAIREIVEFINERW